MEKVRGGGTSRTHVGFPMSPGLIPRRPQQPLRPSMAEEKAGFLLILQPLSSQGLLFKDFQLESFTPVFAELKAKVKFCTDE